MGFINFQTTDTNEHVGFGDAVLLIDDNGRQYFQPQYLGYGLVGGVDIFILTAEMNGHEFDENEDPDLEYERIRSLGIEFFYENENAKLPKIYKK